MNCAPIQQTRPWEANPLFVVLGFLDEYQGRGLDDATDEVEGFYGQERAQADVFGRYLVHLRDQFGLETEIRRETDKSHRILYHSRQLKELIDRQYRDVRSSGCLMVDDRGEIRRPLQNGFASLQMFEDQGREVKLCYLAGVAGRYREGSAFRFANAEHKGQLVLDLLKQLGCTETRLEHANPGHVPRLIVVHFRATEEVAQWLAAVTAVP